MTRNISTMAAVSNGVPLPSDIRDTNAYNRLALRRAIDSLGDLSAEVQLGGPRESLRVLIVDDYRDSADAFSMLVEAWGHDVRRAYDGPTGLALADEHQPHVLLFDIAMPDMNGLEFFVRVRSLLGMNDCLMAVLTGCTDAECWMECANAGIDLFLVKPLEPSILQEMLTWKAVETLRPWQDAATPNVLATVI
jgi:two-component system OmpR family response regulator